MTPAQLTTLKADIAANTATVTVGGVDFQVKDVPRNGSGAEAVADWYNLTAAPDFFVWDIAASADAIMDNITGANYEPADVPDNTVTYQNRAIVAQTKLMSIQVLLQGRSTFNAAKKNLRAWLNSATTSVPSGPGGATRAAGWNLILPGLSRKARNAEKVLAVDDGAGIGNVVTDTRGANTNPDFAAFEGLLIATDVQSAWAS
jgi:hypothetical protein